MLPHFFILERNVLLLFVIVVLTVDVGTIFGR